MSTLTGRRVSAVIVHCCAVRPWPRVPNRNHAASMGPLDRTLVPCWQGPPSDAKAVPERRRLAASKSDNETIRRAATRRLTDHSRGVSPPLPARGGGKVRPGRCNLALPGGRPSMDTAANWHTSCKKKHASSTTYAIKGWDVHDGQTLNTLSLTARVQHHCIPTRLLDVTQDPLVAADFAASIEPRVRTTPPWRQPRNRGIFPKPLIHRRTALRTRPQERREGPARLSHRRLFLLRSDDKP
jgi:FRG domain